MEVARNRLRRGSIYMAVLSAAMIITVIGLTALAAVRVQRRGAEGTTDFLQARLYAQSAIEMGLLWIDSDPNWRSNFPNGTWAIDVPIGDGTFTLNGVDPADGNLADSDRDAVDLTGIGVKGEARFKLQVTLDPVISGLTCLEASLHAGVDLDFSSATVTGDQIVSANNNVTASFASVAPDVEAVGTISGSTYLGTQTAGITPRIMPNPVTVFDYYLTNGTPINIAAIASCGAAAHCLRECVLSPANNPYGATTNAEGIYVLDCLGQDLVIKDCRIVGTLVLLNTGAICRIDGSMNWQPAVTNYPAILVSGAISFRHKRSKDLDEANIGVNFNPPGTPYGGLADTDKVDVYPTVLQGLMYVSGNAWTFKDAAFVGVVLSGGTWSINNNPDFLYAPTFLSGPPPGFSAPPQMAISPGSWRQTVN